MPVASIRTSRTSYSRTLASNLAHDANRRRLVHGPLQPMDADAPLRGLWRRLLGG